MDWSLLETERLLKKALRIGLTLVAAWLCLQKFLRPLARKMHHFILLALWILCLRQFVGGVYLCIPCRVVGFSFVRWSTFMYFSEEVRTRHEFGISSSIVARLSPSFCSIRLHQVLDVGPVLLDVFIVRVVSTLVFWVNLVTASKLTSVLAGVCGAADFVHGAHWLSLWFHLQES